MKALLLSLALACAPAAMAFHKDFTLVNDRAPLEFRLLFETMRTSLTQPEEQVRLVAFCQRIDRGLGPLKKDQAFFLLKSEVYGTLLTWKFPASPLPPPGPHTLQRLRALLAANKAIYTPFSLWVIESLLADYESLQKDGLLGATPDADPTADAARTRAIHRMRKLVRYTRGWVEKADLLSAQDFNALTMDLSWRVLERVNERAALFRRHSSQAVQDTHETTFNIPETGMPRKPAPVPTPEATPEAALPSERASKEKVEADASVRQIDVKPADIPAEELSKEIEKVEAGLEPSGSSAEGPPIE